MHIPLLVKVLLSLNFRKLVWNRMGLRGRVRGWRLHRARAWPWILDRVMGRRYRRLTELELRKTRKSETIFIFGSGSSINEIPASEWREFERHDTLSFNLFVHQDQLRIDYHMIREIGNRASDTNLAMEEVSEYTHLLRSNPHFVNSILLVQSGWTALGANYVVGRRLLPRKAQLFRFQSQRQRGYRPPSRSFKDGLVHGTATLIDCINFAYILGWKRVVLVGVDLYDRRYFWLDKDQSKPIDVERGSSYQAQHNSAIDVIDTLGQWIDELAGEGVQLYVYNPRSLLTQVLPLYDK